MLLWAPHQLSEFYLENVRRLSSVAKLILVPQTCPLNMGLCRPMRAAELGVLRAKWIFSFPSKQNGV
ncbi:hypothetical protein PHET_07195 [Paragonimus heterotremus]|uniref:Uncharacterized protein n=1 Tax=Paragonimus heterotremus TaxID=100268 RepID=A0A8J4SN73_9TREM|nr:hypothetical protein PHET_07195 [Paragonimus heterotremus]